MEQVETKVDVLAVMAALMSAASDAVDTNDAGNYMELPDERHEVLEARYGSVPRSQMAGYALTRLFNAREDAIEARAAIAELIEAGAPLIPEIDRMLTAKRDCIATPDDEDECERLEAMFDRYRAAHARVWGGK